MFKLNLKIINPSKLTWVRKTFFFKFHDSHEGDTIKKIPIKNILVTRPKKCLGKNWTVRLKI